MRYEKKSAKAGDTAQDRALVYQATATTSMPMGDSIGVDCSGYGSAKIVLKSETGTSGDITAWIYDETSDIWLVAKDFGTTGTLQAVTATNDGIADDVASLLGASRLYLQVSAVTGAGEKISAWATLYNENLGARF